MARPTPLHAMRSPPFTGGNPGGVSSLLSGQPGSSAPSPGGGIGAALASPNASAGLPSQPSVAPGAPPQGMPMQVAPPGRQMTEAVAQHLQMMPPDQRAQAEQRADYLVHVFGTLARKPDLTRQDVIMAAGGAIADGKATPAEAAAEVAGLPQNPKQLRAVIEQRFKAQILAASLLSGSQQQGAPPGAPTAQMGMTPQQAPQVPTGGMS